MTTRALAAIVVAAASFLSAACSNSGDTHSQLDPYLCTQTDLGETYQQLTDGSFSPGDLADLGPNARQREPQFHDAGMQRGKFVLFKEVLPKPPFDPQVNVVCQVLEFRTAASATEWLLALRADETIATSLVAWLPRETLLVHESVHESTPLGSQTRREFTIIGSPGDHALATFVLLQTGANGRFVQTIAVGVTGNPAASDLGSLVTRLWTAIDTRRNGN